MLDREYLEKNGVNITKSLELFGDMDMYNDSLKDFQKEIKNRIENIKKYKQNGDMANYSILVHSLKSDSRYFGFDKLAELSENHEHKSKENDIYYVSENFDELEEEAIKIMNLVNEYLGTGEKVEIKKEAIIKDKSILVVDDSNVISNYITAIFDANFNIIVAKDGEEALDKLNDHSLNISILLLDLNLPKIDGYEILKYMQEKDMFKNIKVAIVTGSDSEDVLAKVEAGHYPVKAVVEKPFNELSLREAVKKLM